MVDLLTFGIGFAIGALLSWFLSAWVTRGRAYAAGYEDGNEDQIPMGGTCDDCGWEAPPSHDIMAMVQAAMQHSVHDCPARGR